ncbi:Low-affinity CO2 hydration protein CphX [Richelia intracellularis HH01]|uniref:Low-affinity CO2 hydration protein CphX n=1 Tax=Richelia intracellularis HH01 TaxID=1165094 RepID=M1WTD7_9NOST|nr:Low-affinity CO2 hydration protein CphX [Richelia intracellularis HH01]
MGILKSYGIVLDKYSNNLIYIAENQFLVFSLSSNTLMGKLVSLSYYVTGGMAV